MTLLSEKAMQYFKVETLPVALHFGGGSAGQMIHYKGGLSTLMDIIRDEPAIKPYLTAKQSNLRWCGCTNGETPQNMLDTAHCETAFRAFEAAKAGLQRPLTRGKPTLSVVGGSFSLGRILIGHPVSCYRRPKQKLSPQKVDCTISVSSGVDAADVSKAIAKITNAAYRYHMAGGAITFTVHYLLGFHKANPETKAQGLVVSLDIPFTSGSLAAFSGSVQFFRAVMIPLAQAFSGQNYDSLTVLRYTDKNAIGIHGYATDADKAIEQLKIIEA